MINSLSMNHVIFVVVITQLQLQNATWLSLATVVNANLHHTNTTNFSATSKLFTKL